MKDKAKETRSLENPKSSRIKIGEKAFLLSALIILALMIGSGVLTRILPAGLYDRVVSEERILVVNGTYREIPKPSYPVWRWFTAPFEILNGPENITPIVLMAFILVVGGSISILEYSGVMEALINSLVARFAKRKYLLLGIMVVTFMSISSFVGMFEEMIPFVIFIIPLAISLGWDSLTGLGMSLLPIAFGFSAAVTNVFTIGIAQKIAGLPLFSGAPLRLVFFMAVVCLTVFFVMRYAKKIEGNPQNSACFREDELFRAKAHEQKQQAAGNAAIAANKAVSKSQRGALLWFVSCIALVMIFVISTARLPVVSDLAFPMMMLMYLTGGIGAGIFTGLKAGDIGKTFVKGMLNILPGVILILMAYSVKHIIATGMIMDTILYRAAELIRRSPPMTAAFLVYASTLAMNFFIGSASAKAFLMMPLLSPLADLAGITRQIAVQAFAFGDGFSNMIFPTNPLLLIALSFSVVSYAKWIKWTWKLQIVILIVTSAFLAVAVKIGFGPF